MSRATKQSPPAGPPPIYRPVLTPWVFELSPLDVPDAPPEAIRVRRLLKALARQHGLRVEWPSMQRIDADDANALPTPGDAADAAETQGAGIVAGSEGFTAGLAGKE